METVDAVAPGPAPNLQREIVMGESYGSARTEDHAFRSGQRSAQKAGVGLGTDLEIDLGTGPGKDLETNLENAPVVLAPVEVAAAVVAEREVKIDPNAALTAWTASPSAPRIIRQRSEDGKRNGAESRRRG